MNIMSHIIIFFCDVDIEFFQVLSTDRTIFQFFCTVLHNFPITVCFGRWVSPAGDIGFVGKPPRGPGHPSRLVGGGGIEP